MKNNSDSQENKVQITDNQVVKGENISSKIVQLKNNTDDQIKEDEEEKTRNEEAQKRLIERLKKVAESFFRVGDDYHTISEKPNIIGGGFNKELRKISKVTITDDYTKKIIKLIQKYDGFINKPSHVNYEKVVGKYYNEYYELTHKPQTGKCDNILHIVKHIFGESHFDFALDYIQILYTNPTQRLPILLLESSEKNTGKSTFGTLLTKIFQDNTMKIGNSDLENAFNGFWLPKLVLVIDEASINKDGVYGMLKRMSTETGKVVSNSKNKTQVEVPFFGKFLFCSNEEGKAVRMEKDDPRFAVFKVPTFKEKGYEDMPDIENKMIEEIPFFIDFILNRKLCYSLESRMYFNPKVYATEQLQLYYKNSFSKLGQSIKQVVENTFQAFPEVSFLSYSVSNLVIELGGTARGLTNHEVQMCLEKELKIKRKEKNRYIYHSLLRVENDDSYLPDIAGKPNACHYTFMKNDILE